ncbi:MAG: tRNA pseudouridine(55) synthase TruB [Syntrophaceae bacterium]|nr:tRNA pseudouridine(55) synthase TruB [Syntrophaceae bacterium]
MHGILLLDKPEGLSSHQVVKIVKKRLGSLKVGHTGTLDPAASGLLVILTGVASRALDFLDEAKKRYILGVRIGEVTDTCDREGQVISTADASGVTKQDVLGALSKFHGSIPQVPPHFSAIKKDGAPLYKLARRGIFPEITPRVIVVHKLELIQFNPPDLGLDLVCSKGTYARAIARDLGEELGVGARLETLRRISSGQFNVSDAVGLDFIRNASLEEITERIIPLHNALNNIPQIITSASELKRLTLGGQIRISNDRIPVVVGVQEISKVPFRVFAPSGGLLIIVKLEMEKDSVIVSPSKVFNWLESSLT